MKDVVAADRMMAAGQQTEPFSEFEAEVVGGISKLFLARAIFAGAVNTSQHQNQNRGDQHHHDQYQYYCQCQLLQAKQFIEAFST